MRTRVVTRDSMSELRPRSPLDLLGRVEQPPALVLPPLQNLRAPPGPRPAPSAPSAAVRARPSARRRGAPPPEMEIGDSTTAQRTDLDGPHDVFVGRLGDADRLCADVTAGGRADRAPLDVAARAVARWQSRAGRRALELRQRQRSSRRAPPARSCASGPVSGTAPRRRMRARSSRRAQAERGGELGARVEQLARRSSSGSEVPARPRRARPSPQRCPGSRRAAARAPARATAVPAADRPSRRPGARPRAAAPPPRRRCGRRRSSACPSSTRSEQARRGGRPRARRRAVGIQPPRQLLVQLRRCRFGIRP